MSRHGPSLTHFEAEAYEFPFQEPESDGTERWNKTTLVVVRAHAGGHVGLGYSYADASAASVARSTLFPALRGKSAYDVLGAWMTMLERVRNLGRPGLASMAISAIDVALWDLKAKLVELPLLMLLGAVRESISAYGSGGFTSFSNSELEQQLAGWVAQGIRMVKMKVGREPDRDLERVRAARSAIGPDTKLFVDANGAYSRKQALEFAELYADLGVTWFEEPVSSDDLDGLRLIRDRAPSSIEIAAGEYGFDPAYFNTMLAHGAVDVAQIDGTRCLGITGFLKAAAVCDSFFIPVSAHTSPSLHAHLCCAIPHAKHVEYFADHIRVEGQAFDGAIRAKNGLLTPDLSKPGLGLELKLADLEKKKAA